MLKYLGSKRTLVPVLTELALGAGAHTAVDLFTGTTRVAQGLKRAGLAVTACDIATYSEVLARTYVATDADRVDAAELADALARLDALPGRAGFVTETYCERARFFHPRNGARIDAIRDAIEEEWSGHALYPLLLTSLLEAADRVDSTVGVQMAYLKDWAPRALTDLHLRAPVLIPGSGRAVRGDALDLVDTLPDVDLMYLDPPYNQHRYFTNYHIWETLVRWDHPETYGVAQKRVDAREESTKSAFNRRREMPRALRRILEGARARTVVLSYNDESWIDAETLQRALLDTGRQSVRVLEFPSRRYVGARIGIHGPTGEKVGRVSHLSNTEYVFVAGEAQRVEAAVGRVRQGGGTGADEGGRARPATRLAEPRVN